MNLINLLSALVKCHDCSEPSEPGKRMCGKHLESARQRDRRRRPPGCAKVRRNNLRRYGITPEQYDAMLAAQGGHCAICPATERDESRGRLHVDHDHATGKVRGLLCMNHNHMLGQAHDNPAELEKGAAYLRAHKE